LDRDSEILHNAQRLRYEAFSAFASAINKCSEYNAIAAVLSSQLKYIINCYIFRVYYQNATAQIAFQGFRGQSFFFHNTDDAICEFERTALVAGIPATYNADQTLTWELFVDTIFAQPRVFSIAAVPVVYSTDHQIVVSIATTQDQQLVNSDYKFIQLVADLLANKLSQLLVLEGIAKKNKELEFKNQQITTLNQYLDITVKTRTQELTDTNSELKTLLYRTTHDFRAPLANIMGLVGLGNSMTDDPEALVIFEHCCAVAANMDKMLSKLNATMMPEDESNKLELIDLCDVIASVEQKYHELLNGTGYKVRFNDDVVHPYYSYENIVTAIFDNLIHNSITFRKPGEPLRVYIDAFSKNNYLNIVFKDNGQGIDPAIMPKIFDMYYRGNAHSTGHGLGLYLVQKLVKSLKGDIEVRSELNQYTTFTIKLPYRIENEL